jgi:hypothetical protein
MHDVTSNLQISVDSVGFKFHYIGNTCLYFSYNKPPVLTRQSVDDKMTQSLLVYPPSHACVRLVGWYYALERSEGFSRHVGVGGQRRVWGEGWRRFGGGTQKGVYSYSLDRARFCNRMFPNVTIRW